MPFQIVRNDLAHMSADAIVNTANPAPVIGPGTDARLHQAAGSALLQARQKIGAIAPGDAAVTPAYALQAKYVIHTVGPAWIDGTHNEALLLKSCYEKSLQAALALGCRSIAFPLISSGHYGFPKDKALQIAISAFSAFLMEQEMQIYLVVFDRTAFRLSERLVSGVASYIDENYVQMRQEKSTRRRMIWDDRMEECSAPAEMPLPCAPMISKPLSLDDYLKQADAGFTETLLKLIDKTGKKDSEIYKKANLSKQHFSKIRNNPCYKPTKPTAIALALALELNLEETRDLIGRAGYALTNSSIFDLIICYFIENRNYNVVQINCVLFEHDQSLLGS